MTWPDIVGYGFGALIIIGVGVAYVEDTWRRRKK